MSYCSCSRIRLQRVFNAISSRISPISQQPVICRELRKHRVGLTLYIGISVHFSLFTSKSPLPPCRSLPFPASSPFLPPFPRPIAGTKSPLQVQRHLGKRSLSIRPVGLWRSEKLQKMYMCQHFKVGLETLKWIFFLRIWKHNGNTWTDAPIVIFSHCQHFSEFWLSSWIRLC